MLRLVLKGHTTRGMEVIQLLVMLGAKSQYTGTFKGFYYWIEDGQVTSSDVLPKNSIIFSLEEFEKKYPYKVGDNVTYYIGTILTKETRTIIGMQWDSDKCRILYYLDNFDVVEVEAILYRTECKIEQSKNKRMKDMDSKSYGTATIKYIQENGSKDIELIIPYNQEIVNIDGRYILRDKKPQYPKTYEECCKVIDYALEGETIIGYKASLLRSLQKLLICRDAWWKMADDWKPNYNDCTEDKYFSTKFFIYMYRNEIHFGSCELTHHLLAFPTAEMRDVFYDAFEELINEVKELL